DHRKAGRLGRLPTVQTARASHLPSPSAILSRVRQWLAVPRCVHAVAQRGGGGGGGGGPGRRGGGGPPPPAGGGRGARKGRGPMLRDVCMPYSTAGQGREAPGSAVANSTICRIV